MKLLHAILFAIALSNASGKDVYAERRVVFHRDAVPLEWSRQGAAHPQQQVQLNIALQQRNLHKLEELFWAVADPRNGKYGNFMEIDEILDIVAPSVTEHDLVMEWLQTFGIDRHHIRSVRDAILVKAPVSVVEAMFQTQLHNFVNPKGRMIVRQMGEYSVPETLGDIIQMVTGLSDFPMSRPKLKSHGPTEFDVPNTDFYVVPETISTMYNFRGLQSSNLTSQGVAEFQDDASYSSADLSTFYKQTSVSTDAITHVVGPFSGTYPDTEATLDIQYLTAVGLEATNWYWTEQNWMYDFSNSFFNSKSVPHVVSMSWGWSETAQCDIDNDCSTLGINSETYVNRTNIEFQKIGLRGVSLLASSGDSGANGRTDSGCSDTKLHPIFPGGSPYITSVGATEISNPQFALSNAPPLCKSYACASGGTEVSVSYELSGFTSGGGFSTYSTRPAYQKKAVTGYLTSAVQLPPSGYFAAHGRGYPDIAALGHNFLCYISGQVEPVGGTSASAPTIGGIVSVLNSYRLKNGQKQLGFLNTFLYQMWEEHPAAFNDVVSGDNSCTEDGCAASCKGFKAYKGWDPVSGLGTPNVGEMIKYIESKSNKIVF